MNTVVPIAITDRAKVSMAQHFLSTWRDHNWHVLASLMAEDIVWKMPGNNSLSGVSTGIAASIECARKLIGHGLLIHLNNIQPSYSGFVLSLRMSASEIDLVVNQPVSIIFTLADDKISAVSVLVADVSNWDLFFSGELLQQQAPDIMPMADVRKSVIANIFLTAMKANDWDMMRSILTTDMQWTLPGQSLLSGPADGVDAVVNRAQSLKKFGVMFQLLHILYGWDSVALSLHNTANRDGLILDEYVTIAFKLDGSKVTGMTTHLSDVPGIEAFFVPGIIF